MTQNDHLVCPVIPGRYKGIEVGPSYDNLNQQAGIKIRNSMRFFKWRYLDSEIDFRLGSGNDFALFSSHTYDDVLYIKGIGSLQLEGDYDYIKPSLGITDIHAAPNIERFGISTKLERSNVSLSAGYLHQRYSREFFTRQHGLALGVGINRFNNFYFDLDASVELLMEEIQYSISVGKSFRRTTVKADYKRLAFFESLSLSTIYRFWYR